MNITIIETGEAKELIIIEPKTGIAWTNDLLGNYDALPNYDDKTGGYLMAQDDYDWWYDLIERYQAADNRYHKLSGDLDNDNWAEFMEAVQNINTDLEYYPDELDEVCNQYESRK